MGVRYLSDDDASILVVILITVRIRISVISHFILPELVHEDKD